MEFPLAFRFARTTEAKVISPGVWLSLAASARDVAGAILIGAQKRAAPVDKLLHARFRRIEAIGRPFRSECDLAASGQRLVVGMLGCIQPMSSPMMKRIFGFAEPPPLS
jgi:hypothetical protein